MAQLCERALRASRALEAIAASRIRRHIGILEAQLDGLVQGLVGVGAEDGFLLRFGDETVVQLAGTLTGNADSGGVLPAEAIITADSAVAARFMAVVPSSTVIVNASTRLADGAELGLGAETGISTSKLHAYGTMGAEGLTAVKYVVSGNGQVRI